MQFITTVTQKGQITIPKKMRERLGIYEYNKVFIETADDHIKIKPAHDILELAGKFKPRQKKTLLKTREIMEKKYRRF